MKKEDISRAVDGGLLSDRGRVMLPPAMEYLMKHFQALGDVYDPVSNPQGYVSLAVAENKLTYDVLQKKLLDLKVSVSRKGV